MSRGAGILAALAVATLAVLWLGLRALPTEGLEDLCGDLRPGDPLERVYRTLGPEGYRSGCGEHLPCQKVLIDGRTWELSCTKDDCDQLWRRDGGACDVVLDPASRAVVTATWSARPDL